jgi:hypothetical protein
LIAGGSLCGILFAMLVGTDTIGPFQKIGDIIPALHSPGVVGQIASAALFLALAVVTARAAQKKLS